MTDIDKIIIEKAAQVAILKAIACQLCSCEGRGYVENIAKQIENELNDLHKFKNTTNNSGGGGIDN
jgi:hypothetical protein